MSVADLWRPSWIEECDREEVTLTADQWEVESWTGRGVVQIGNVYWRVKAAEIWVFLPMRLEEIAASMAYLKE